MDQIKELTDRPINVRDTRRTHDAELVAIAKYRRVVDYLSAAQLYLKENFLLEKPLLPNHIKDRLLGHWGTCPGINIVYAHLNRIIRQYEAEIMLVTGPGHGSPANRSNLFVEGTMAEYFPELTYDKTGLGVFIKNFSWPGGYPSHLDPSIPGVIAEGGELGYSLSIAYGAALDNPNLIVACIVGDGEAETGPLAASWNGNKFINPVESGAVLPILHLNGYKISSPTIFGTMNNSEITNFFNGLGYDVHIADDTDIDADMYAAMDWAYNRIRQIQNTARSSKLDMALRWPLIVMKTPKGFGGVKEMDGEPIEGSYRSHQVPIMDPKTNPAHLELLENWLRSYNINELFDENGIVIQELRDLCPKGDNRMAVNVHAFGGDVRKPLNLPDLSTYYFNFDKKGDLKTSGMTRVGEYLRDLITLNSDELRRFRIVSPDELISNKLNAVFDVTTRTYEWPVKKADDYISTDGSVIEILSEHVCQGLLQGYILTGRHGLFPSYEAFMAIVDSMLNQYAKFLKVSLEVPWRKPVSSLNYLLTSLSWRQEHNGYSHQAPGFINNLLNKKSKILRVYIPCDPNSLLFTVKHCLESTERINIIVAGKDERPNFLNSLEVAEQFYRGIDDWKWASNETKNPDDLDVIMVGAGDYTTEEVLAAADLLLHDVPELKFRVVNVLDLMAFESPLNHPHGISDERFAELFPANKPVIVNYIGYPSAVKQLLFDRNLKSHFFINGYMEEGTTTTPFDMYVRNNTSRYQVAMQAIQLAVRHNPIVRNKAAKLIAKYSDILEEHKKYIKEYGKDMEQITDWKWSRS